MNARHHGRHVLHALIALLAVALFAPTMAHAAGLSSGTAGTTGAVPASGGGGLSGGPIGAPSSTATNGKQPVSVSGAGVTLDTTSSSLLRRDLTFSGSAPSASGQQIDIEIEGTSTNWIWEPVTTATVASDGSFDTTWNADQAGRFAVRAMVAGSDLAAAADATPSLTVTIYRQSKATIYGPGFYGQKTACGSRLTKTMIGVANRTLPCGSTVSLLYKGETISVPVIDRGPYANHANWDLTMATAQELGIEGTEQIGAVALPRTTGPTTTGTTTGTTGTTTGTTGTTTTGTFATGLPGAQLTR